MSTVFQASLTVADPDLQIRGEGGRGWAGHPDLQIRGEGGGGGGSKIFLALQASVWFKNSGGGALAGSATV